MFPTMFYNLCYRHRGQTGFHSFHVLQRYLQWIAGSFPVAGLLCCKQKGPWRGCQNAFNQIILFNTWLINIFMYYLQSMLYQLGWTLHWNLLGALTRRFWSNQNVTRVWASIKNIKKMKIVFKKDENCVQAFK